jgi:hypothetical protein
MLAILVQVGLLVVAALCLVGAVLHTMGVGGLTLDETVLKLLAVALVALGFGQVTKFKGFGIEVEKQVAQLTDNLGKLEKEVGPGSKSNILRRSLHESRSWSGPRFVLADSMVPPRGVLSICVRPLLNFRT